MITNRSFLRRRMSRIINLAKTAKIQNKALRRIAYHISKQGVVSISSR
jgi:hypothetical protein